MALNHVSSKYNLKKNTARFLYQVKTKITTFFDDVLNLILK